MTVLRTKAAGNASAAFIFLFFGSLVNGRNANAAAQKYSCHPKAALGRKKNVPTSLRY